MREVQQPKREERARRVIETGEGDRSSRAGAEVEERVGRDVQIAEDFADATSALDGAAGEGDS